jgi:hypothetical protein
VDDAPTTTTTTAGRGGTVIELPKFPPGAVVGDAATRVLLALTRNPGASADQLAELLNRSTPDRWDTSLGIYVGRWTAERVDWQLRILRRVDLAAILKP